MASNANALRRHGRRLLKHAWWMGLAVSGQYLCRNFLSEATLRGSNDVGGNFLQTFGGIYGVIVAFTIFMVWQQHNETQMAVEREAVALEELHALLGWFTAWPARDEVREQLRAYARVVPQLNGARPSRAEDDDKRLLGNAHARFLTYAAAPAEERFFTPALDLFHELNEAREHRVTVSGLRLPEGLKWFVYLGGAISVCSLWLLWVDSRVVHSLLTAGMTWVIVAASSLILDLDDPYTGDFVVEWDRFAQTAARMDATDCPPGASRS